MRPKNISAPLLIVTLIGITWWQNSQNQKQNREMISEIFEREAKLKEVDLSHEKDLTESEKKLDFYLNFTPEVVEASNSSNTFNPNDKYYHALQALIANTGNYKSGNRVYKYNTITDINGDGLNDIIYHHYASTQDYCDNSTSYYTKYEFKVFLNSGNGFDQAYYCRKGKNPCRDNEKEYLGDCAG